MSKQELTEQDIEEQNIAEQEEIQGEDIAVIGMGCRFPNIHTPEAFWQLLSEGQSAISFFSDEQLQQAGVAPELYQSDDFINARGTLEKADYFDAGFFAMSAAEARHTDPQHRIFLELAWHTLEHGGYNPDTFAGLIGVYAGADANGYALANLAFRNTGLGTSIANDRDYLATRTSFKLNLRGPSVNIANACSTSLIAVQMATRSLLDFQCDMALAGGIGIAFPQQVGAIFQQGSIMAPDGICRAFDAQAQGTVGGDGAGLVLLKRLEDAIDDNDTIHALIKGAAVNNDGCNKVGFTAPSVEGQAEVIAMAQALADVHPETISYIEAHGTGTKLGDPIEITALSEAFAAHTDKKGFCAIGSVKTNLGHMNAAAGIGGMLKAILAMQYNKIPPSLNYTAPNPMIDFDNSPFYVNHSLSDWPAHVGPKRCAVSSFGIGGTNAHIVMEQAPLVEQSLPIDNDDQQTKLLLLSARSSEALQHQTEQLKQAVEQQNLNLTDMAYTLLVGRKRFSHSAISTFTDKQSLLHTLEQGLSQHVEIDEDQLQSDNPQGVTLIFPGQGCQHPGMGKGLYQQFVVFRDAIDTCAEHLQPTLEQDIRELMFNQQDSQLLAQTHLTQPLIFAYEYAQAKLLQSLDVPIDAMIGHSVGEYVAACIAEVFSLEDALDLIALRGKLISAQPQGAMFSAIMSPSDAELINGLALAAINGPNMITLSGPIEVVEQAMTQYQNQGIACTRLNTSHAFHSDMMQNACEQLKQAANQISHQAPTIPYISNLNGQWIEDPVDGEYWAKHCRQTVNFAQGSQTLLNDPNRIFVEVGPSTGLTTLAPKQQQWQPSHSVISASAHAKNAHDNSTQISAWLSAIGQLSAQGVNINWQNHFEGIVRDDAQYKGEEYEAKQPRRIALPTYPFERKQYNEGSLADDAINTQQHHAQHQHLAPMQNWCYLPSFKRVLPQSKQATANLCLVFSAQLNSQDLIALQQQYQQVIAVNFGQDFAAIDWQNDHFGQCQINPINKDCYHNLLTTIIEQCAQSAALQIIHAWSLDTNKANGFAAFKHNEQLTTSSLTYLVQQLTQSKSASLQTNLTVLINGCENSVSQPSDAIRPDLAPVAAFVKVINQEHGNITAKALDVIKLSDALTLLNTDAKSDLLLVRGKKVWAEHFEQLNLTAPPNVSTKEEQPVAIPRQLTNAGVYLITGGLGELGIKLATYLAQTVQAKLILVGRSDISIDNTSLQSASKTAQIEQLEALGSEVIYQAVDITDAQAVTTLCNTIESHFGRLNGVFHLAGIVDMAHFTTVNASDPSQHINSADVHQKAKIEALYTLAHHLPEQLDFVMCFSSLSVALGGLGFASYSAANRFMDVFAASLPQSNQQHWQSIGFDAWVDEATITTPGIAKTQAEALFAQLLNLPPVEQILVSTMDLNARLLMQQFTTEQSAKRQQSNHSERHPRPKQSVEYIAPTDELEAELADIWQDLLGFEQIGIEDNFFKLGGDSLQAIQLSMAVRDKYNINLSVNNIFDEPTIKGLAEKLRAFAPDSEIIEQQLDMIENMTEEQVAQMLADLEAQNNSKESI